MPWDFFVIDWFYFFFLQEQIFFVNLTVLHFLITELNGNIRQSMRFDGTFMQMNFWKTSSHIILWYDVQFCIKYKYFSLVKWWFTLLEHQNPISLVTAKFFEVTLVFCYNDDNCVLAKLPTHFFAYQQGKFSDFTHFLFWKFFWNVQCGLLLLRQISLGYLHSTKCVLEGC